MPVLISDPRVRAITVRESGEPLVPLSFAPEVPVRSGLAARLVEARVALPTGLDLRVAEGHRSLTDQQAIIDHHTDELRVLHPGADAAELEVLSGRFVSPIAVAPHVAGAAVDLTLVDDAEVDPVARGTARCWRRCCPAPARSTTRPSGGTGPTATGTGRWSPAPTTRSTVRSDPRRHRPTVPGVRRP